MNAFNLTVERTFGRLQAYTAGQTLKYSIELTSVDILSSDATKTVVDMTTTEHYTDSNPKDAGNVARINGAVGTREYTLIPQGNHLVISQELIKQ
jgi:hypothetical protein